MLSNLNNTHTCVNDLYKPETGLVYQDLSSKKALAPKLYLETNNKQYTVTVNPLESVWDGFCPAGGNFFSKNSKENVKFEIL